MSLCANEVYLDYVTTKAKLFRKTKVLVGVFSNGDRARHVIAPFAPRAVVVANVLEAEQPQDPVSVRRTDATLSIGDDVLIFGDSDVCEHLSQLIGVFDDRDIAPGVEVDPFEVD